MGSLLVELPGIREWLVRDDDVDVIKASGLFDVQYYQDQVKKSFTSVDAAIADYLEHGHVAGVDPCAQFSTMDYLHSHSDIQRVGILPLLHFIKHGLREGRYRLSSSKQRRKATIGRLVREDAHLEPSARADVTVIIPVYADTELSLNTISHVLNAANRILFNVLVLYDAGPDRQLEEALRVLAEKGHITLVINEMSLGFAGTCNRGFELVKDGNIVILNSDTEVHGDWLDRLHRIAQSDPSIGSVTPFSNNATIASYPNFAADNWDRLEIADRDLDQICNSLFAGVHVEMPVGIGFCMYMTAAALRAIGYFDVDIFGRGYGEEVDWCRRAVESGFRNVLAPGIFVTHFGGSSFGTAEKRAREIEAGEKIEALHPGYKAMIDTFLVQDPIKPFRRKIDDARIAAGTASHRSKVALLVCPRWPGGTERHVLELSESLSQDGYGVLRCQPAPGEHESVVFVVGAAAFPNIDRFSLRDGPLPIARFLKNWDIAFIHVHHFLDFPTEMKPLLVEVARILGVDLYVTLHDYFLICPRVNLVDEKGYYCGEPEVAVCETCAGQNSTRVGRPYVWKWLSDNSAFLSAARRVFVPTRDVLIRMQRHLPGPNYMVRPHRPPAAHSSALSPIAQRQAELFGSRSGRTASSLSPRKCICVIGSIGPIKGSALLLQVARCLKVMAAPVKIVLIGFSDIDHALNSLDNITLTGAYHESDLDNLIALAAPDLIWFPALWPETFSYTLSHALRYGAPIAYFDFGAIAERTPVDLRVAMPPETMLSSEKVVSQLLAALEKGDSRRPYHEHLQALHSNTSMYYDL